MASMPTDHLSHRAGTANVPSPLVGEGQGEGVDRATSAARTRLGVPACNNMSRCIQRKNPASLTGRA